MVTDVSTLDELKSHLEDTKNKGKLIVLDCFATWCGPCQRISPTIDGWSTEEFKDTVIFLKADVDKAEDIAEKYDVESMPTFILFKDGEEIERIKGAVADKLKEAIEKNCK